MKIKNAKNLSHYSMPNQLRVSDFTYVASWQGMVCVAFVIDVFARCIVGWPVSTSMTTGSVLDALNQAICQRAPSGANNLIHHSDRGSQDLSIRYTERLVEAGIDPSVGSVGNSYDNALAESTTGLFKTEVIGFMGPWKSVGQVERETLEWANWHSTKRLHGKIGYITPQEAEENLHEALNKAEKAGPALRSLSSAGSAWQSANCGDHCDRSRDGGIYLGHRATCAAG